MVNGVVLTCIPPLQGHAMDKQTRNACVSVWPLVLFGERYRFHFGAELSE